MLAFPRYVRLHSLCMSLRLALRALSSDGIRRSTCR
ncbi:unnamed protein product, partial [Rotaria magnacalcarata]